MQKPIKKNTTCLVCGGSNLTKYLDLGQTALANSYVEASRANIKDTTYPLRIFYCSDCHLAQLLDVVNRNLLFENYAYFSSTSPQLLGYFEEYAKDVFNRFPKQASKLVVEIASNDGILLKPLKKLGAKVLGVDPAKNIAEIANSEGIQTLPNFFDTTVAQEILQTQGHAGIISANNVLAHTDELHEIIKGVKLLLDADGVFIFEVQYLGDLISKNEFDNTYHEHISYFSLSPIITLLKKHGLEVFDVQRVSGQGGSLRIFAGHLPLLHPITEAVKLLVEKEASEGLYELATYQNFAEKPQKTKKDLVKLLTELKKSGKTIVGYGAPAKGNTLLQYCGIGTDLIDYIVDAAPSKQGKLTPGTHIPIFPPSLLREKTPDYILILAWNYADSIIERESWLKDLGVKFIKPVPEVTIL